MEVLEAFQAVGNKTPTIQEKEQAMGKLKAGDLIAGKSAADQQSYACTTDITRGEVVNAQDPIDTDGTTTHAEPMCGDDGPHDCCMRKDLE